MSIVAETQDEHRTAPRRRTLISAQIRYAGGAVTVDCVVRNVSETGAKIDVSEGVILPERFDLVIPQKNVVHACLLRWRREAEVGVSFLQAAGSDDEARPTPAEDALKARIRALEEENARLRARIAELCGS